MEQKSCCFSGHRYLPPELVPALTRLTGAVVRELAEDGYTGFLCGGAQGFDTLAAEIILRERVRSPALTLTLALPYPGQSDHWPEPDRERYHRILDSADEVLYLSDHYHRFCMQQRNRYMVDHSRLLVCYLTAASGGTAGTVDYALGKGVLIRNLAMEL